MSQLLVFIIRENALFAPLARLIKLQGDWKLEKILVISRNSGYCLIYCNQYINEHVISMRLNDNQQDWGGGGGWGGRRALLAKTLPT